MCNCACAMLMLLLISSSAEALSVASSYSPVFSGPAIFERVSHFKDVGVPAVVQAKDLLNQAMIADGTCRLLSPFDGYAFFHNRGKVESVIDAISKLPSSRNPSYLVLTAQSELRSVCMANGTKVEDDQDYTCRQGYSFKGISASMHNWHRALCAPEGDAAWGTMYDPAYQPQQEALTMGFMCMLACDCNKLALPLDSLASFVTTLSSPDETRERLCGVVPWGSVNFTRAATNPDALAELTGPLISDVCKCK